MTERQEFGSNRPIWPLSQGNRAYLEGQILKRSSEETPEVKSVNSQELLSLIDRAIQTVSILEEAAGKRHKTVHSDTDVVWVLSAPGTYSSDFPLPSGKIINGDKYKAQYNGLPGIKELYRHRVRTGVALIQEITAKRTGKPAQDITQEDIKAHGPWLVYNPQPKEEEQIREVLANPVLKIPPEKVFIFTDVIQADGARYPIYSTIDQIKGLRFPLKPRRVAVVSHAPHLTRVLFSLDHFKDKIPGSTAIQTFPINAPKGGELMYAEMEIRAILAYIYKYEVSGKQPMDFEV